MRELMFIEVEYIPSIISNLAQLFKIILPISDIHTNSNHHWFNSRDGFDQGTMFFRKSKQASIHADELNDKIGEIIG